MAKPRKSYRIFISAGGVVLNDDDEILFCHPTRSKWDNWRMPKGMVDEDDESVEKAALREVLEETGYSCTIIAPLMSVVQYKSRHRELTVIKDLKMYLMRAIEKVEEPDWENDKFKWVSLTDAPEVAAERELPLILEAIEYIKVNNTKKGKG